MQRAQAGHDQVAVITGGTRGIGYATAEAFLRAGARVAFCGRDAGRITAAEKRLAAAGEVVGTRADVSDVGEIASFIDLVLRRFHRIDVLINNAGIAWSGDFAEQDLPDIGAIVDVNVKGVLYATRLVLPHMLQQASGVIINLSSGAGLTGFAGLAAYCASKFAVVGFTESLAQEVSDAGVYVYAVCPGRVATDMQRAVTGERVGIPPERVAERMLSLALKHPSRDVGRCLDV